MADTRRDLETALVELERLARDPQCRPDRHHARALLVPLGELLLAEGPNSVREAVERAREAGETLGEGWEEALRSELSLAAAEHVHAVDARYLALPNYDFAYTVRARERLEARLAAAAELDFELRGALRDGIRRADERLAPYLDQPE